MYLIIKDSKKADKYSTKAIAVWRAIAPHYGLTLDYKNYPQDGLDDALDKLKTDGKLFDFDIRRKQDDRCEVRFEINAMELNDDELASEDGEDFDLVMTTAKLIDSYFPEKTAS